MEKMKMLNMIEKKTYTTKEIVEAYKRGLHPDIKWIHVADVEKIDLLPQEEHDYLVHDLGFAKVKTRCPVCYTKSCIELQIKQQLSQSSGREILVSDQMVSENESERQHSSKQSTIPSDIGHGNSHLNKKTSSMPDFVPKRVSDGRLWR
jgi:hypothetical protein